MVFFFILQRKKIAMLEVGVFFSLDKIKYKDNHAEETQMRPLQEKIEFGGANHRVQMQQKFLLEAPAVHRTPMHRRDQNDAARSSHL